MMALEQLIELMQRCHAIQDESYCPEDYDLFQSAGTTCIQQGEWAQLLSMIADEENKNIVRCMGWNLLAPLVQVLQKKEDKNLSQCFAILTHLLEICHPKELLVGLLEQVEEAHTDAIADTVLLLLQPLKTVLLKLGEKKASSVGMTLSALLNQVSRLPVPCGREQELVDAHGVCRCCSGLLTFLQPFVEEAAKNNVANACIEELRAEILKFCMKSLRQPLLDVQLASPDTLDNSPLREFALEVVAILSHIGESFTDLLSHNLLKKRGVSDFLEEEVRFPKDSLASLAYLLFVQHMAFENVPAVLSPIFLLQCNMEHVQLLLSRTEETHLQKGLDLYEKSLERVEDGSLPVDLLELNTFFSVPQNLVKVMTMCPFQHLRTKGFQVFQMSINRFCTEAKYKFFICMLKTSHHSGVEGVIIKNIKNQIHFSSKTGDENEWFQGKQFLSLLRLVLCLPQGPETDLLQYLDRIMETLNLVRYLLIRDKDRENGMWTEISEIKEKFIMPLRVGLNMSKAHYEVELNNFKENKETTVTVSNKKLQDVTTEVTQVEVFHAALTMFDMMESVLVRIEELIEAKAKPLT
ncbi:glomulin, FKBP associated protein a [Denticeps clupeoides]|uniref:Glomulin n=1 Tax=Denticeps clupeoides TaxID=299321 RepID=A0AAY4D199_9TELE|nr:glomulin [Denticeps clupeoides]XP_028817073.1 glomulin [Denticeps clupeoides]XP_028817074.1 glomulin [Denticeps clupeoides]